MSNPYQAPEAKLYNLEHRNLWHLLFSFEGRISRTDFWKGLAITGLTCFFIIVSLNYLIARLDWSYALDLEFVLIKSPWSYVILLFALHPLLAVTAKRYHDLGKSGWLGLIWLAPLVGWMFAVIECGFGKGFPMRNKYGPPIYGPLVERSGKL